MCPQHRRDVIAIIRNRLKEGIPTYVISTSLIEAGVDLDFPVAYRALAGLDSIAQTAGRCNREGKLDGHGQVYYYEKQGTQIPSFIRKAAQEAKQIGDFETNLHNPDAFKRYYNAFVNVQCDTGRNICNYLETFDDLQDCIEYDERFAEDLKFRKADSEFKFIKDDEEITVFIPYNRRARILLRYAISHGLKKRLLRALNATRVMIFRNSAQKMMQNGFLIPIPISHSVSNALTESNDYYTIASLPNIYDNSCGLNPDTEIDSGDLIFQS